MILGAVFLLTDLGWLRSIYLQLSNCSEDAIKMQRRVAGISLLFLGLFSPGENLFANVIHVPADQPTIQAAINAAVNGDTVQVSPGTYIENINFLGKAITVAGDQTTLG